jgi:hypothetical protein
MAYNRLQKEDDEVHEHMRISHVSMIIVAMYGYK